jgi:short subunit dehydrogenase-like uncharacterized protein
MRSDGRMVPMEQPQLIERTLAGRQQTLVQIPWADMITSYVSTGIPTIEVFQVQEGELPAWLPALAQYKVGRRFLAWMIDTWLPEGPPPDARSTRQTRIEATVINAAGDQASAQLITPEAYQLTFHSALLVVQHIFNGQWQAGFQTPAKVYGPDLVLSVPGVTRSDL